MPWQMSQVPPLPPSLVPKKESREQKSARAAIVLTRLNAAMPEAKIELDYQTPLQLLVAVILSAQCTDRRVNMVTPKLFADFPHAAAYAKSTPAKIAKYINSLGLFRNKAKSLVKLGKSLEKLHGGKVPIDRAALVKLPGVGPKTAGVVTMHLGGDHAFPVDTHVLRLSKRLGFSRHREPDAVEQDLQKLWPATDWFMAHQLIIWHGRRVCHARSPECHRCVVFEWCPRIGVKRVAPPVRES